MASPNMQQYLPISIGICVYFSAFSIMTLNCALNPHSLGMPHSPHFTDEEAEAPGMGVSCPRLHS
ncbi:unnamed protein product [Nyctereutes procyonoides]|uniref:(raccoon dog) hypothetical protein n=1 Tax=Nyctereutes procyonoides TaxID=34880 RepID=A0A811YID3_NYCPR|nr:unnamed protein product [Nyctereutes procyonoides]